MTQSLRPAEHDWTVDDLFDLPDNGSRYEIVDGRLLVSPVPAVPHLRAVTRLRNRLKAQAPDDIEVGEGAGLTVQGPRTYLIPDIWVANAAALEKDGKYFDTAEFHLVVEVLSPSNAGTDTVLKRHYYAVAGIPTYWILDPTQRRLVVLQLDPESGQYVEDTMVTAGQTYSTDRPYPMNIDLDEIC